MCKIRRIWYSCGCSIAARLSTCRATRFKYSWNPKTQLSTRRIMCSPHSSLDLASQSKCGSCLYAPIRKEWDGRIAEAEDEVRRCPDTERMAGLLGRIADLKVARDREEWACKRLFPTTQKLGLGRLKRIGRKTSARSPLAKELFPEDIEDMKAGWKDEDTSRGAHFATFDNYCMDKYTWMGPPLDLARLMRGEDADEGGDGGDRAWESEGITHGAGNIDWGDVDWSMDGPNDRDCKTSIEPGGLLEKESGGSARQEECAALEQGHLEETQAAVHGFEGEEKGGCSRMLSLKGIDAESCGVVRLWLRI